VITLKEIYFANGRFLRQRCPDFSSFGQDGTRELARLWPEVPYDTVIIDEIYIDEVSFICNQIYLYWGLEGKAYDRKRDQERQKLGTSAANFSNFITKIIDGGRGISWVEYDGKGVRENIDGEVFQGVNDLIYSFVPPRTVGVENQMNKQEKPYILLHELIERIHLTKGLSYRQSHHLHANLAEKAARRRDKILPGCFPGDKNFRYCSSFEEFCERFELKKA